MQSQLTPDGKFYSKMNEFMKIYGQHSCHLAVYGTCVVKIFLIREGVSEIYTFKMDLAVIVTDFNFKA